jgi:hypothetical protein
LSTSVYSDEIVNQILERVSNGEPLAKACRELGTHRNTFYDWLDRDETLPVRFARAREAGFDAIADECFALADEQPELESTAHGQKRDAGYVAWKRMQIDTRLKLLAKWDPKRYGERIEQAGSLEVVYRIHRGPKPE